MNEEQDLYWYLMMLTRTMMKRRRVFPSVQSNEEEELFLKRGLEYGSTFAEPQTFHYRTAAALVKAVSLQQVAHNMPSGRVKSQLEGSTSADIEDIIDDWCGTKPHWPPRPHTTDLISEIYLIANSFEAGPIRDGLTQVATKIATRALDAEGFGAPIAREKAGVR